MDSFEDGSEIFIPKGTISTTSPLSYDLPVKKN